jgi:prevent-host-death family protein
LAEVIAGVSETGDRLAVTKHGRTVAFIVSVDDMQALEALEDAQDRAAYLAAKAEDSGERISLEAARRTLAVGGA